MKRILNVKRIGLPETNSSSSHSVSISMKGNLIKPGDPEFNIDIRDEILYIPGDIDFGWNYFKYNTPLEKLQYVCGIFCGSIEDENNKKNIFKLKKILKKIFEVKDVVFEWRQEYYQKISSGKNPDDVYYASPGIDHNSSDIFEEITENTETIKNFILSRDSWLFGGNDNTDYPPTSYYLGQEDPEAILSIDLGGKIGRLDFEIPILQKIPDNLRSFEINRDDTIALSDFCWVESRGEFDIVNERILMSRSDYFLINSYYIDDDTGKPYFIFCGDNFIKTYKEKNSIKETIKLCNDYKLAPIHIKLLKYNVII